MLYRKDKNGNELSMLGFGCMRFARKGNGIDMEKAEEQIMAAFRAGVNYYDTAYIYPGSEAAIGEIFERNQIRDKINIATKLPQYMIKDRSGLDKYFNEELSRLRTSYVDYYLMHHLTDLPMWEKLKDVGILDWIKEKKASGAIRNIGFSYHGNTDNFQKILNDYDWDFCQIQYNYLDEVSQAGVDGLRAAAAKGLPIREKLKEADKALRPLHYRLAIHFVRAFMYIPLALQPARGDGRAIGHEFPADGGRKLQNSLRGRARPSDRGGLRSSRKSQRNHPRTGKSRLHRLPLLHALSQRRRHSGNLPLLQRHVHRIQKPGALPVRPDRRTHKGTGLCHPVCPMRKMRAALSPGPPDPREAQGGGQGPASSPLQTGHPFRTSLYVHHYRLAIHFVRAFMYRKPRRARKKIRGRRR